MTGRPAGAGDVGIQIFSAGEVAATGVKKQKHRKQEQQERTQKMREQPKQQVQGQTGDAEPSSSQVHRLNGISSGACNVFDTLQR